MKCKGTTSKMKMFFLRKTCYFIQKVVVLLTHPDILFSRYSGKQLLGVIFFYFILFLYILNILHFFVYTRIVIHRIGNLISSLCPNISYQINIFLLTIKYSAKLQCLIFTHLKVITLIEFENVFTDNNYDVS